MLKFFAAHRIGTLITIAVLLIGSIAAYASFTRKQTYNLIEVTQGDISQEVIVTGTTTPVDKLDLAFQRTGRISRVLNDVGSVVSHGSVLVELDSTELAASLSEAEANAQAQAAKLDELLKGTRPEDIQITRTNLAKAQQDLTNEYNGVTQTLSDAYAKTNDAVRNQLTALFTNGDGTNPQFTFPVSDSQAQIDAQSGRVAANTELSAWKDELTALNSPSSTSTPEGTITKAQGHLAKILIFLNRTMDAVVSSPSSLASTYKTNVTTALSAVNASILALNTKSQNIASEKIAVNQAQNNLNLDLAGATPETINADRAQLAQAEASVAVVRAQLDETILRSPIAGTVTKMDGKVGEVVSANVVIASIISQDKFEIDSNIPEVDIGKIAVGNTTTVTFDAFPDETFSGKVIKIDPAETVIDGVVNFKTTVILDHPDSRLKSGLTANLSIETQRKSGVLILPQEALVEKKEGTFVKKYENGTITEYPVTIGIRDANGKAEIISGVSLGEKVVNIGLKAAQ